jgi:FMN phosphatase YigB (HAD superfamily)
MVCWRDALVDVAIGVAAGLVTAFFLADDVDDNEIPVVAEPPQQLVDVTTASNVTIYPVPRPPTQPCLVVFDLDRTLLKQPIAEHREAARYGTPGHLSVGDVALDDLFFDAECLVRFQRCCRDAGHVLRIGTRATARHHFGNPLSDPPIEDQIAGLFDALLGGGDLTRPEHIAAMDAVDKCAHLQHLERKVGADHREGFPKVRIVLIDDDLQNVDAANHAGYRALHCPDGFHREWLFHQRELCLLLGLRYDGDHLPNSS